MSSSNFDLTEAGVHVATGIGSQYLISNYLFKDGKYADYIGDFAGGFMSEIGGAMVNDQFDELATKWSTDDYKNKIKDSAVVGACTLGAMIGVEDLAKMSISKNSMKYYVLLGGVIAGAHYFVLPWFKKMGKSAPPATSGNVATEPVVTPPTPAPVTYF